MKILSLLAAGAVLLSAQSASAAANLLINPSFEAVAVTAADDCQGGAWCLRSFASTPGWTQTQDGVDLVHNNYVQGPAVLVDASDGVQFLDMNQHNAIGGLFQTVSATAGATYGLSLDTTAWATNSIGGTIGYQLYDPTTSAVLASGSYTDNVGGTWITRTLSAQATSNQIGVSIYGIVAVQAGMGLDNVSLVQTAAAPGAVPEPATWAMLLTGLGLLGAGLRGRRATVAA
jgi:hypothetical protein